MGSTVEIGGGEAVVGSEGILYGIGIVDENGKVRELRLFGTVGVLREV